MSWLEEKKEKKDDDEIISRWKREFAHNSPFLSARPMLSTQLAVRNASDGAIATSGGERKPVLVVGADGTMRTRLVDPNNLPKTMQRVPMTSESLERLVQQQRDRETAAATHAEERRKALEDQQRREKEARELEMQQLQLSKPDRERKAAEAKLAAEKAALERLAEENRLKKLELEALEAKKEERVRKTAEAKRRAAEAAKETELLRLKRLEEENKATELTIKALELQRDQVDLEAERKLLEEKNKSVELDLQMQSVKDWKLECAICLSAPARFAVIPCGHYVLCGDCSKEYVEEENGFGKEKVYRGVCPMCRVKVDGLLRIFVASKLE